MPNVYRVGPLVSFYVIKLSLVDPDGVELEEVPDAGEDTQHVGGLRFSRVLGREVVRMRSR